MKNPQIPSREAIHDIKNAIDRALVQPGDELVGYMVLAISKVPSGGIRPMVAWAPPENLESLRKKMREWLDDPNGYEHHEWGNDAP